VHVRPDCRLEGALDDVTDAMPNAGETGGEDLESRLESAAEDRIYSTFVGVGIEFNTELVETTNAVRGGNYYAVHSPQQFRERMDEAFEAYFAAEMEALIRFSMRHSGIDRETARGRTGKRSD
jgi:Ca-activated chloride channel family protein